MDSGDTAWLLMSSALVMFMVPGLALFYAGMVRGKNVLAMLMKNYVAMGVVTITWIVVGYSIAFSGDWQGWGLVGDLEFFGLGELGVGTELGLGTDAQGNTFPDTVHLLFQLMFAIINAGADRGRGRGAHEVQRVGDLHRDLVDRGLRAAGPTGCGAAASSAAVSAIPISRACRRSTSPAGLVVHINAGVAALAPGAGAGATPRLATRDHSAALAAADGAGRRDPVVRLVRVQRRLGVLRRRVRPATPS